MKVKKKRKEVSLIHLRLFIWKLFHLMRICVPPKINFSVKCSIAHLARERFETWMFSTVSDEIARLTKRFSTLLTFVRLLARVNISVFFHVRFLMKSLSAVVTGKRSRVWVNKHVSGQSRGSFEGLVALLALKSSLVGVDFFVLFQTHCMTKRFPTDVASKRAPSDVRASHVDFQTVRCAKHFLAAQAIKGFATVNLFRFLLFLCVRLRCTTCKHLRVGCHTRYELVLAKQRWLPVGKAKSLALR